MMFRRRVHEQRNAVEIVVARCSCKKVYDLARWLALPLCGDFGDEVEMLELRNCSCGSTIAAVFVTDEQGVRFYEEKA